MSSITKKLENGRRMLYWISWCAVAVIFVVLVYDLGYTHGSVSTSPALNCSDRVGAMVLSSGDDLVFIRNCTRAEEGLYECGRMEWFGG